jgi:ring-1,2-phenylacetyl-CoA epoxidase subunit PaaA
MQMNETVATLERGVSVEDQETALQRRIADGFVLEDQTEMTERYRNVLMATMLIAADLEIMTLPLDQGAMMVAASIDDRIAVASALQDEMGHAQVMFRMLQEFGYDPYRRLFERDPSDFKTFSILEWEVTDPIFQAVGHICGDSPGYITTRDLEENCSFGPYSRSLRKVNFEEQFHVARGEHCIRHYMTLGPEVRAKVQKTLDFLFPLGAEWFGATDEVKSRPDQLTYKIRGSSNDGLRQQFLARIVPFCEEVGLKVPAHYDEAAGCYVLDYQMPILLNKETMEWDFTTVPWSEKLAEWKKGGPFKLPGLTRIQQERWGSELW